jgi:hypothetical protein
MVVAKVTLTQTRTTVHPPVVSSAAAVVVATVRQLMQVIHKEQLPVWPLVAEVQEEMTGRPAVHQDGAVSALQVVDQVVGLAKKATRIPEVDLKQNESRQVLLLRALVQARLVHNEPGTLDVAASFALHGVHMHGAEALEVEESQIRRHVKP